MLKGCENNNHYDENKVNKTSWIGRGFHIVKHQTWNLSHVIIAMVTVCTKYLYTFQIIGKKTGLLGLVLFSICTEFQQRLSLDMFPWCYTMFSLIPRLQMKFF